MSELEIDDIEHLEKELSYDRLIQDAALNKDLRDREKNLERDRFLGNLYRRHPD